MSGQDARDVIAEALYVRANHPVPENEARTAWRDYAPDNLTRLRYLHMADAALDGLTAADFTVVATARFAAAAPDLVRELLAKVETAQKWAAWFAAAYNWRRECDNALNWGTTCLNCASMLDRSYHDYMRAERAEEKAEAAAREALAPIREAWDWLVVDLVNYPEDRWPNIIREALGVLDPLIYTSEELDHD